MNESTRRTVRTVFQLVVSIAALAPVLVPALGLNAANPKWAAACASLLAAAAVVTKVVNDPRVDAVLPGWLKKSAPEDGTL